MLRLWNWLIYGEKEASKWEDVKVCKAYSGEGLHVLTEYVLIQKNQYGRIRKVKIP